MVTACAFHSPPLSLAALAWAARRPARPGTRLQRQLLRNQRQLYGNKVPFTKAAKNSAPPLVKYGRNARRVFETAHIRRSHRLGVCNPRSVITDACLAPWTTSRHVSQRMWCCSCLNRPSDGLVDHRPRGTWDRDISFWVGTVSPTITLTGATFSTLASLGFSSQVNSLNGAGETALTIGLGGLVGNALLVGALNPGDGTPDRFKIRQLVTSAPAIVPLPAAAWLFLSALGSIAGLRRSAPVVGSATLRLPLGPQVIASATSPSGCLVSAGRQRPAIAANGVLSPGRQRKAATRASEARRPSCRRHSECEVPGPATGR